MAEIKQIQVPVQIIVKEISQLNTAIAKELSVEDNRQLFFSFFAESVKESGNVST
jgi:hypothetical protein